MACGGVNGGYTLFIADHKLYYEYNCLNTERYAIVSPELPSGRVDLKFNFVKTGNLKGTGELYVNGKKIAEGAIDQTVPGAFSLTESFDVGVDNGAPVSNHYKTKDHFRFTGELDKVIRYASTRHCPHTHCAHGGRLIMQRDHSSTGTNHLGFRLVKSIS